MKKDEPHAGTKFQVGLRLRKEIAEAMSAEAAARGVSRTLLIEQVLARFLKEQGVELQIKLA